MRKLLYILLCGTVTSCASKQMSASIASLEKQNQTLRSEIVQLQEKVNNLSNDMLVVQSRDEHRVSVIQASPPLIVQQPVVVPDVGPSKPSVKLQNSVFGDDIKFSDDEPSLKFTNKDLTSPAATGTKNASPVLSNKPKGNFTEQTPVTELSKPVASAPTPTPTPTPSAQAVPAKTSGIEDPAIVAAYNKAYKTFKDQNYQQTISLMGDFLKKYPSHPYSDNAIFWMGESYFQLKNYEKADKDFEKVIQQYPNGNKVPDALLRSGICKLRLSEPEKAKVSFDQLMMKYPESMAAKRAKATLGEI